MRDGLDFDPTKPHLTLLRNEFDGHIAIPPGASMCLVEDATRADGVFPLILAKVTRKKWYFICGCRQPTCNRRVEMPLYWKGFHPRPDTAQYTPDDDAT